MARMISCKRGLLATALSSVHNYGVHQAICFCNQCQALARSTMADQKHPLSFFAFLLLVNLHGKHSLAKEIVPVGVILDLNSPVGGVAERCMSMALSDFYAVNADYNTRLALLTMDSGNDVIAAASAESGVSMLVLVKDDEKNNFWIFLKPLSLELWFTTCAAFVFTGLVIWVLEHRINSEFRGTPDQQLGMIFWFSFSTLVFAHRERMVSNWSRFVMIIWFFAVLILTQSYTASLASILTVQKLQPMFVDVKEIKRNGYFVGYQNHSFVKGLLIKQLNFNESKLKPYSTPEEYHEALLKGINNGGVAAIFDEIPYIKLFLAKYCSKYTVVGPTYKTDGFGFAFPQGSSLAPHISRAILNVTQDTDKFRAIEQKYFSRSGSTSICEDSSSSISSNSPSLGLYSFGGLFIITGVVSLFSLLVYVLNFLRTHWPALSTINRPESSFVSKLVEMVNRFDQREDPSSHPNIHERYTSWANVVSSPGDIEFPHNMENHSRNFNSGGDRDESLSSTGSPSRRSDTVALQVVPN